VRAIGPNTYLNRDNTRADVTNTSTTLFPSSTPRRWRPQRCVPGRRLHRRRDRAPLISPPRSPSPTTEYRPTALPLPAIISPLASTRRAWARASRAATASECSSAGSPLRRGAGAELPHPNVQRSRSHRRWLRPDLQRAHRQRTPAASSAPASTERCYSIAPRCWRCAAGSPGPHDWVSDPSAGVDDEACARHAPGTRRRVRRPKNSALVTAGAIGSFALREVSLLMMGRRRRSPSRQFESLRVRASLMRRWHRTSCYLFYVESPSEERLMPERLFDGPAAANRGSGRSE